MTGTKIFTSNGKRPWAEALAVKNGGFIYVGDSNSASAYQSDSTRSIDRSTYYKSVEGAVGGGARTAADRVTVCHAAGPANADDFMSSRQSRTAVLPT